MTGPSYPLRGAAELSHGETINYRLPRSDQGRGRLNIAIPAPQSGAQATLEWRRYPTALDLARDLERHLAGQTIRAVRQGLTTRMGRPTLLCLWEEWEQQVRADQ